MVDFTLRLHLSPKVYSEPSQTSKMKLIRKCLTPLNCWIFSKTSVHKFDWVLNVHLESIYQLLVLDGNMDFKWVKGFGKIFLPFKGLKTEHMLRIMLIMMSCRQSWFSSCDLSKVEPNNVTLYANEKHKGNVSPVCRIALRPMSL